MIRLILCLLPLCLCGVATSQDAVSKEIQHMKAAGFELRKVDLLKFETADIQNRANKLQGLKKGTILSLNPDDIQALFREENEFIQIAIPQTNRSNVLLTLKRHEIFASDFSLFTSSNPEVPFDYEPGLYYKGIVEGDLSSLVAVSVFHDQMMAMIATDEGNFVIGQIEGDAKGRHILYNDRDLDKGFDFECNTPDDEIGYTNEQLKPLSGGRDPDDCVRIYIEIDDNIVTDKGGVIPATDYITGLFNQSFVLYANEQLNLTISEMFAWTTTSPYEGTGSQEMLNAFQANTEYFNGDLSHLVSFGACCGVAEGGDNLCMPNPDNSKCFTHIDPTYNTVPTYSWSVFAITHEMGHLLGSAHTHACVWNGNNTAIDGCAGVVQGSCPLPSIPPDGGTIMSYCYLPESGSFVNFNLGFGPQPGSVIRNEVNEAGNCITACGQPTSYCTSNGVTSNSDYINKVVLGSINNTSGNNGGYADYTSLSTNLQAGNVYTITLYPKPQNGNHTDCWKVWIDYNNDFDWYDAGEIVGSVSGRQTVNITFTVPAGSPGVTTRMRVSMRYQGCPAFCGTFPYGEVEDYTVVIVPNSPTCSDGVQNQGETGIDCGGPCPACPTCNDGIQNQGETGIDCGGPCTACPQGDSTILLGAYFETGWDTWADGGSDVARVSSSNSYEGQYSIRLADNSSAESAMTSPAFDLSTAVGLKISFHFFASSMESGEDFWVQYNNGTGNWTTIGTYTSGSNFSNNTFYQSTVIVPDFAPTSAGSLRIQCDASDNNDQVFIDAVVITKLNGSELIDAPFSISESPKQDTSPSHVLYQESQLLVYPNPVQDVLNISFNGNIQSLRLISLDGREIHTPASCIETWQMDISALTSGMYFLQVVDDRNMLITSKFLKQ